MNTLTLINLMRSVRERYAFTAAEQALFYELVEVCNKSGWKKEFTCSNLKLKEVIRISEKRLIDSRESLVKAGLIMYVSAKEKRRPGTYSFIIPGSANPAKKRSDFPVEEEEQTTSVQGVATVSTTNASTNIGTTQSTDNIRYSIQKTKESIKERFDNFRKLYPGVKRGLETEYKNFLRHADHAEVVDQLQPALQKLLHYRTMCKQAGVWIPDTLPHLRTWIHQRRWEEELNVQSIVNAYAEKQRTHQGPTIVP